MSAHFDYSLTEVPESFYEQARENVIVVGELHAMDEKPAERLDYVREVANDINKALEKYNSGKVVFNGDTGSADHVGLLLSELEADEAVFLTGDEDRKRDDERNYMGWAGILEPDSDHFSTDVEYGIKGEHVRLDREIKLPGDYPVHIQHFPEDCRESKEELGFQAAWFAEPDLYDLFKYDISPTMDNIVQVAIHGHTHGYDARQIGYTALISLGALRNNYVTNSNLPENSLQAFSFGAEDFEVVHQSRKGKLQESQRFKETKNGFKLVESHGKDSLTPLERYEKSELPPRYLKYLQQGLNRKKSNA